MEINSATEYNSHNAERLDISEMKNLLMKLSFIRKSVNGVDVDPEL